MFRNYITTAFRNLMKNKAFSFISIFGLSLGIACSLLIILWVRDEKAIGNFHNNGNRLFIIYERVFTDNKVNAGYHTPGVLAREMKRRIPEIEYASSFAWESDSPDRLTFEAADKIMKFNGCYADSDYFKMMSYPLLKGQASSALTTPLSLCISEDMANSLFGNVDSALGKMVRCENKKDYSVTGVFKNLPVEASAKFDFLINWSAFLEEYDWAKEWGSSGPNTFIMLRKESDPLLVEQKIKNFLDSYLNNQSDNYRIELGMQRYGEKYLNSNFKNGFISGGRIEYVRLFSIVAVLILLIACINHMNLTTARSTKRAKEIGVRKVAGALRSSLVRQFLGETLLITFISVLLSLVIMISLLPLFNELTGKNLVFPSSSIYFWSGLLCLTLITGFISGSYPSLFLSSFKPIAVLKGTIKFGGNAMLFRKGLVVFQFILSIILIIGTIVVSRQVSYMQKMNLGFNKDNLIYIPLEGDLTTEYSLFRQQALNQPGIKSVSRVSEPPTSIGSGTVDVEWEGKTPNTFPQFTRAAVGLDFVKTLNLRLLAGREFSESHVPDSTGYLVNEETLKIIGYDDPIGKSLTLGGQKGTIIGVLKDFHFSSLHTPIQPLVMSFGEKDDWGHMVVRIDAGKTTEALTSLKKLYKELNPKFPFNYVFADEEYRKLYRSEQLISNLSDYFSILAIFISCLGLLGLAMYTAEQRRKEIGIRKVLGASMPSLLHLLSKEYILLVLLAQVIATPIAWWVTYTWLQDFAYRVPVGIWVFVIAGLAAVAIAILTVSYQALKVAVANPVKSLRTE
jgi:ABC-type antimicrobial peptide transport system permease subunit